MNRNLRVWVEGTIIAAMAMALSYIPLDIGPSLSISLGQIPLTVFALRRGWKPGVFAAALWGLLHFPAGKVYYLAVSQVLIEYPIAFAFAGFAGVAAVKLHQAIKDGDDKRARLAIIQGTLIGVGARYFWHFVAGVIFWGAYAVWGMSPFVYSLVTNGISGIATGIVSMFVALLIYRTVPKLYDPK
ncbi:energy-coupled thiamine transporter ThiT [Enterococcus sp. 2201sp1_2201st1_B8_2201SCRN_220225]|uniref:energy-coupled thiamine transporter ThiT n=1 Tax=unclassified Enterococcus TaxID=2608891 RepID=UPI0034A56E9A